MSEPCVTDDQTAGYQSWRKLTFVHWRVSAEQLQPLIPDALAVETWDGSAWLGIVPFSMERIRPWWAPPVPWVSWFLETNVRTYVVDKHGVPGVWFFSLDANSCLAVAVARKFWNLPYQNASLTLAAAFSDSAGVRTETIAYDGTRQDRPEATYRIRIATESERPARPAAPGSLDHFLVERYRLYTQNRDGLLLSGRVHHHPYQIQQVLSSSIAQTLTNAMGCPIFPESRPDHIVYSPGVDVRVSPLRRIN